MVHKKKLKECRMSQENKTLFYCNAHAAIAKLTSKAEVHQKKHPPETSLGLTHFLVWLIWLQNKNHLPRTKQQRRKRNLKDQRSLIKLRKWNSPPRDPKERQPKEKLSAPSLGFNTFLSLIILITQQKPPPRNKEAKEKENFERSKVVY